MSETTRAIGLTPVILAGGSGTRLWPLSRRRFPKHLIALTSERTLLQECAERVSVVGEPSAVLTVGAQEQGDLIRQQLAAVDPELVAGVILEPAARNTAAACCAAALRASERFGGEQILWVCAADHVMDDTANLYAALDAAIGAAKAGRLVTFGIEPGYAEPGFGYIKVGEALEGAPGVHDVARFIEKPERPAAERMLEEGGYLWNSGMFVFRADVFLAEMACHAPDILQQTRTAMAAATGAPLVPGDAYRAIRSEPVDKAVMEISERVAVVPCDPRWSDVGSWRAVWEALDRDERGNASRGDVILEEADNCLVLGDDRLVAVIGVKDLAIVDTGDAIMIADRDDSAAVKRVVGMLQEQDRSEAVGYPVEVGAWGERRRRCVSGATVVSELTLVPGGELSMAAPEDRCLHVFGEDLGGTLVLGPGERRTLINDGERSKTFVEVSAPAR